MLPEDAQERLIKLGADRLAEELIKLAFRVAEVYETVERLISSPEENRDRFLKRLGKLRRGRKFYDWRTAPELAGELEGMLEDLRAACPEPKQGLELLAKFYACDGRTLERCDDSDGWVGSVFSEAATDLFTEYAKRCQDKAWVADLVFRLYLEDDYGVRHGLLTRIADYLPEEEARRLAARLLDWAEENPKQAFHCRIGVETIAQKLKDPRLFERAALLGGEAPTPGVLLQIAEVYLEADEPEEALEWLERVPPPDRSYFQDQHDHLRYEIYTRLGRKEEAAEVAWNIFRRHRSKGTLELLLRAIGEERREEVVAQEVAGILERQRFSYEDASFLVELGRLAEAEQYLLRHRDKLDGNLYSTLLPWARALEGDYPLGATVVYRALLESILERAITKYYHHGVRYLRKLESLAPRIEDWQGITPHREYFSELREAHKRKRSFWAKYQGQ